MVGSARVSCLLPKQNNNYSCKTKSQWPLDWFVMYSSSRASSSLNKWRVSPTALICIRTYVRTISLVDISKGGGEGTLSWVGSGEEVQVPQFFVGVLYGWWCCWSWWWKEDEPNDILWFLGVINSIAFECVPKIYSLSFSTAAPLQCIFMDMHNIHCYRRHSMRPFRIIKFIFLCLLQRNALGMRFFAMSSSAYPCWHGAFWVEHAVALSSVSVN